MQTRTLLQGRTRRPVAGPQAPFRVRELISGRFTPTKRPNPSVDHHTPLIALIATPTPEREPAATVQSRISGHPRSRCAIRLQRKVRLGNRRTGPPHRKARSDRLCGLHVAPRGPARQTLGRSADTSAGLRLRPGPRPPLATSATPAAVSSPTSLAKRPARRATQVRRRCGREARGRAKAGLRPGSFELATKACPTFGAPAQSDGVSLEEPTGRADRLVQASPHTSPPAKPLAAMLRAPGTSLGTQLPRKARLARRPMRPALSDPRPRHQRARLAWSRGDRVSGPDPPVPMPGQPPTSHQLRTSGRGSEYVPHGGRPFIWCCVRVSPRLASGAIRASLTVLVVRAGTRSPPAVLRTL
jgi:hypothetical protein